MTVRKLQEILSTHPDDYRVVIDIEDPALGATEENEIVDCYNISTCNGETIPTVILQTRGMFDYEYELECRLKEWADDGIDEEWIIGELYDSGFTYRDLEFDKAAYEWAKKFAEEHGYE